MLAVDGDEEAEEEEEREEEDDVVSCRIAVSVVKMVFEVTRGSDCLYFEL